MVWGSMTGLKVYWKLNPGFCDNPFSTRRVLGETHIHHFFNLEQPLQLTGMRPLRMGTRDEVLLVLRACSSFLIAFAQPRWLISS